MMDNVSALKQQFVVEVMVITNDLLSFCSV